MRIKECNLEKYQIKRGNNNLNEKSAELCKSRSYGITNLRGRESTLPPKFLTLNTFRVSWVALDLFLSACRASNRKAFTRLSGLRNAPLSVDRFAVNDLLAGGAIFVHPAGTFSRDDLLPHDPR